MADKLFSYQLASHRFIFGDERQVSSFENIIYFFIFLTNLY